MGITSKRRLFTLFSHDHAQPSVPQPTSILTSTTAVGFIKLQMMSNNKLEEPVFDQISFTAIHDYTFT